MNDDAELEIQRRQFTFFSFVIFSYTQQVWQLKRPCL